MSSLHSFVQMKLKKEEEENKKEEGKICKILCLWLLVKYFQIVYYRESVIK